MKTIDLNGNWLGSGLAPSGETLSFAGRVPGCVHADLLRQGLIPEPFWRFNADDCQWIENWSWSYEREFVLDDFAPGAYLQFDGLDVYCDVYLNGRRVGSADDMFIAHRFAAGEHLRPGKNQIKVIFYSPIALTAGKPRRDAAFTCERLYTRRMQCTYYWDWVNRFVTFGIFRDVKICLPGAADLVDAYVYTRCADDFGAQVGLEMGFDVRGEGAFAHLQILSPEGEALWEKRRLIVEEEMCETVDIENPRLWWPAGSGEQPLYALRVTVEREGRVEDAREIPFGVRTVHILQRRDLPGTPEYEKCLALKNGPHVSGKNASWDRNEPEEFSGFTLIVNGRPIFCKGANWVPCEPFPSEESVEKIERLLTLAKEAGMNMIRVWGGGLFERDEFYAACDRLGLMVTQDFLMACGNYPEEEEWFLDHLRREAEGAARRLRNHPSLVWWTGDNENAMAADENMPDYPGRRSALKAIGPVLRRLDPHRDFLPSSPYGGRPNGSITRGTSHNTNYIGELFHYIRYADFYDYTAYFERYLCRFCAEEPIMGAPSVCSLKKFMTEEDIFGDHDEIWRYHTKNNPAEEFREFEIYDYQKATAAKLFGAFASGQDRVFKMQYTQYEWARLTMEQYRREKWFSSGLIYWMLDDCWPATGWALIDYYGVPKAGWYGVKRAAKPVICSIEKREGAYLAWVASDACQAAQGRLTLFVQPFEGPRQVVAQADFEVPANTSLCALRAPAGDIEPLLNERCLLMCEIEGPGLRDRTFHFEKRPQDLAFPRARVTAKRNEDGSIAVAADCYVHALGLDGDCVFGDNFFTLLPGEARTVTCAPAEIGKVAVRCLGMDAPPQMV